MDTMTIPPFPTQHTHSPVRVSRRRPWRVAGADKREVCAGIDEATTTAIPRSDSDSRLQSTTTMTIKTYHTRVDPRDTSSAETKYFNAPPLRLNRISTLIFFVFLLPPTRRFPQGQSLGPTHLIGQMRLFLTCGDSSGGGSLPSTVWKRV